MSLSTSSVLAYHGCDADVASDIINGRRSFNKSTNDYDWLGEGTYFWIGSYRRAMDWAESKKARKKIQIPAVIGAFVELRHCLNLTDLGVCALLSESYSDLLLKMKIIGKDIPENSSIGPHGIPLFRNRDCAVIQNLHVGRATRGEKAFDTVVGAFEEGNPAFDGAAIRERSHIQLAVLSFDCIIGTFHPKSL